jgi:hypothetical protein
VAVVLPALLAWAYAALIPSNASVTIAHLIVMRSFIVLDSLLIKNSKIG